MAARRILWLDEISTDQWEVVGGKAANLEGMLRAGFRIPPGFCVTTAAYRAFVEGHDLQEGIEALVGDGDRIKPGGVLFRLEGPSNAILAAERVALNFVQRLTGIATLSAGFVQKVKGTGVIILDTRKTTPLLRDLEKYAVRCGGAQNHRRDLEAMVLVKENHIRSLGGPTALIRYLKSGRGGDGGEKAEPFVEVEVDSLEFLKGLLGAPVNRVMLDNFTPEQVKEGLELVSKFKQKNPDKAIEIEISGGITLDNVAEYALPGVDFISVGALTHSAPAVPLSLEVV